MGKAGADERYAETVALVKGGMKICHACYKTGLSLHTWYKRSTGIEKVMHERKLDRLKKRRADLMFRVGVVDHKIKEVQVRIASIKTTGGQIRHTPDCHLGDNYKNCEACKQNGHL